MTTGQRIKERRKEIGMSAEKLAEKTGLSPATVYRYEKGDIEKVPGKLLAPIAKALQTTPHYLMGWEGNEASIPSGFQPTPAMTTLPIVGRIACGEPILAEENVEGEASVPEEWRASFCLVCEGDSMAPRIQNGDLVAIRKQEMVENGEIAAVRIDGEATLKHVYLYPNYIELRPENPAYASIIRAREEMNDVHIEGKAVGLCRGI